MKHLTTKLIASAVMGACLFAATSGWAVDVYLRADEFTRSLPGRLAPVQMWGFAPDTDINFNDGSAPTSPGPRIEVRAGDTALVVHLKNDLTVPVSIVIPNQNGFVVDAPPTITADAQGRPRARSLVKETQPGQIGTYTWNNLTPGTYLYYSGSHSSLQVQMGLYGAMVQQDAYPGVVAQSEQVVLFSEIDTKVHDAVQNGKYGPPADPLNPPVDQVFSTIHSIPDHFLINGQAYIAGQTPLPAGIAGQTVLLRLLNASVNSRIPVIYGLDQKIIAEDGRLYPYPRILTAPELPALKTMDVLVSPTAAGTYPLYDRALGLANGTTSPGGMFTYLEVEPPPPPSPTPVPATAALKKNTTNLAN